MQRFYSWATLAVAFFLVAGCSLLAPRLDTANDKIAAAQLTLKATYKLARDVYDRGLLTHDTAVALVNAGDAVQLAIDTARGALVNGDPAAVNTALAILEQRLLDLEKAKRGLPQ